MKKLLQKLSAAMVILTLTASYTFAADQSSTVYANNKQLRIEQLSLQSNQSTYYKPYIPSVIVALNNSQLRVQFKDGKVMTMNYKRGEALAQNDRYGMAKRKLTNLSRHAA